MHLSGPQRKHLHAALLRAFPQPLDLTRLVRFHLDQNLAELSTGENLRQTAFELIEWADAHSRLPQLILGACHENPDNATLRRMALQLGFTPMPSTGEAGAAAVAVPGNARVMICLVGEQPLPNVLPILHYQPTQVVLVHSDYTRPVTAQVQQVLGPAVSVLTCEVDAYAIERARLVLLDLIVKHGWLPEQLTFNLTGGTKPMVLAGYRVAQDIAGCTLLYMQTRQGRNECFEYNLLDNAFVLQSSRPQEITTVLDIDRHLRAHGWTQWNTSDPVVPRRNDTVVRVVGAALAGYVEELVRQVKDVPDSPVEIDLVVRCRNQIGLIAIPPDGPDAGTAGINQLNTFGARENLGTYVKRLLVLNQEPALTTIAQAAVRNITVLVVPSLSAKGGAELSEEDKLRLRKQVMTMLGGW